MSILSGQNLSCVSCQIKLSTGISISVRVVFQLSWDEYLRLIISNLFATSRVIRKKDIQLPLSSES